MTNQHESKQDPRSRISYLQGKPGGAQHSQSSPLASATPCRDLLDELEAVLGQQVRHRRQGRSVAARSIHPIPLLSARVRTASMVGGSVGLTGPRCRRARRAAPRAASCCAGPRSPLPRPPQASVSEMDRRLLGERRWRGKRDALFLGIWTRYMLRTSLGVEMCLRAPFSRSVSSFATSSQRAGDWY